MVQTSRTFQGKRNHYNRYGDYLQEDIKVKLRKSLSTKSLISILIFRGVARLSFPAWCRYLNEISNSKKVEVNMIKHKLIDCGPPGVSDTTVNKIDSTIFCILHPMLS